jgi:diphosphomevalonate decarboxylase
VEREALDLHGLMMTSDPSFILLKPGTLKVIELVREFRQDTKIPLCFTLDAGPNVHLLYPKTTVNEVKNFITTHIQPLPECQQVIYDRVGDGPKQLR